jgi:polyvinyl alcohol dehydrogenase (cytochrome)
VTRSIKFYVELLLVLVVLTSSYVTLAATRQEEGQAIYLSRCAACHDHPREQIPPKAVLSAKPKDRIVQALTVGVMQPMGAGLTPNQIDVLVAYLAGDRPVDGSSMESAPVSANPCKGTPSRVEPGKGDWNGWSPDLENTRYQLDPQLTLKDVPRLKPKWVFAYPGAGAMGPPSVIGGRVYVGTDTGNVLSLDLSSGCTYWATQGDLYVKSAVTVAEDPGKHGEFLAYFSGSRATAYAVNVIDGKVVWTARVDAHPQAATGESPKIYGNRVYLPVRSAEGSMGSRGDYPCCTVRGGLTALDASSGELVWRGYTILEEPKAFKKNSAGTQMYGPAGAGVWVPITIDTRLRRAYLGSSESRTDVPTDASDAMMAFDLSDGRRIWAMQATANDNWTQGCEGATPGPNCPSRVGPDADFASPVILRTLENGTRVLLGAQKSGVVHALDPDRNGRIIWQRDLAADAHIPAGVILRDRDQFGVVFGMAADRDNLYVPIADPTKTPGHVPLGLYALSLVDGHIVWHTPGERVPSCSWGADGCTGAQRTAVTAMPGVVFAGSANGHLRAYSTKDGHVLWDFDTAQRYRAVNGVMALGGAIEGSATVISKGTVLVMSGYAGSYGGGRGNALIAFTVAGH